jgi:hypothetical protein
MSDRSDEDTMITDDESDDYYDDADDQSMGEEGTCFHPFLILHLSAFGIAQFLLTTMEPSLFSQMITTRNQMQLPFQTLDLVLSKRAMQRERDGQRATMV